MKSKYIRLQTISLTGMICISATLFYTCNKSDLEIANGSAKKNHVQLTDLSLQHNPFKSTIGAPVDVSTGNRWIENFRRINRGISKEFLLSANALRFILSDSDCVGICIYFGSDQAKNEYLIPIGINSRGRLIKSEHINTSAGKVDWQTAQRWIGNNTGVIDARFFGRNSFGRLFEKSDSEWIKAINAVNDEQQPQLLLAVNYQVKASDATYNAVYFEDRSARCPPVCPLAE